MYRRVARWAASEIQSVLVCDVQTVTIDISLGIFEQTDLVELWSIHNTTRKLFLDTGWANFSLGHLVFHFPSLESRTTISSFIQPGTDPSKLPRKTDDSTQPASKIRIISIRYLRLVLPYVGEVPIPPTRRLTMDMSWYEKLSIWIIFNIMKALLRS